MKRGEYRAFQRAVQEIAARNLEELLSLIRSIGEQATGMQALVSQLEPEQVPPTAIAVISLDLDPILEKLKSTVRYLGIWAPTDDGELPVGCQ